MKLDNGIVGSLKLALGQMVAARRQYRKSFPASMVRQGRRLRGVGWLAALDRAVGQSVQRKRAPGVPVRSW